MNRPVVIKIRYFVLLQQRLTYLALGYIPLTYHYLFFMWSICIMPIYSPEIIVGLPIRQSHNVQFEKKRDISTSNQVKLSQLHG